MSYMGNNWMILWGMRWPKDATTPRSQSVFWNGFSLERGQFCTGSWLAAANLATVHSWGWRGGITTESLLITWPSCLHPSFDMQIQSNINQSGIVTWTQCLKLPKTYMTLCKRLRLWTAKSSEPKKTTFHLDLTLLERQNFRQWMWNTFIRPSNGR